MAKIIDDETIENVCILAKLSLSDEAKEKAKEDMQKMLDYVEKLDELDTDGVEPLSHIFGDQDRKSTRLNSSHYQQSRMPSSA